MIHADRKATTWSTRMSSNDFTLIRGLPLCSFTQPLDLRGLAAGAYLVPVRSA